MFKWIETCMIGENLTVFFREMDGEFSVFMIAEHGAAVFESKAAYEVTFEERLARWDPAPIIHNQEFDGFAVGSDIRSRELTKHDHPEMTAEDVVEMSMIIDIFEKERVFEMMRTCLRTREAQCISIDQEEILWLSLMGLDVNDRPSEEEDDDVFGHADVSADDEASPLPGSDDDLSDSELDDILELELDGPYDAATSHEDEVSLSNIPEDDLSGLETDDIFGDSLGEKYTNSAKVSNAEVLSRKVDEHRRDTYLFDRAASAIRGDDEILARALGQGPDLKTNLSDRLRFLNHLMEDLIKRSSGEDTDSVTSLMDGLETVLGYNDKSAGATALVLKRMVKDADSRIIRMRGAVSDQRRLCRDIYNAAGIDREVINRSANANAYLEGFRTLVLADPDFDRPLTGRGRFCFENLAAAASLTPQEILATPGIGETSLNNILAQIREVGKPCPALSTLPAENRYADRFSEAYGPWGGNGLLRRLVEQEMRDLNDLDYMLSEQVTGL